MYKATRSLIKARQPHTNYVVEVVAVKQVGGGAANQCFQNATDDSLLAKGNKVVSGWVVNPYDKFKNSTAIVQHWWNINSDGIYFDTTLSGSVDLEYVIDSELADFGQVNLDRLSNLVALSLLLKDDSFFGVHENLNTESLSSLATHNLFDLKIK